MRMQQVSSLKPLFSSKLDQPQHIINSLKFVFEPLFLFNHNDQMVAAIEIPQPILTEGSFPHLNHDHKLKLENTYNLFVIPHQSRIPSHIFLAKKPNEKI